MTREEAVSAFQEEYGERVRAGGWSIDLDAMPRQDGTPRVELRKHDLLRFPLDERAWLFVVVRARLGSPMHLAALSLVDPSEIAIISRRTQWVPVDQPLFST